MGVLIVGATEDRFLSEQFEVGWARRVKYKSVPFVYQEDRLFPLAKSPFFLPSFGANFDNRVTTW